VDIGTQQSGDIGAQQSGHWTKYW